MDFTFTAEEEAFREEVRQWLKKEITPRWIELDAGLWEETEESWALSREFQRKLAQKGWLAPAYPKEYGGLEMGHIKRLILSEELNYNRAPISIEVEISVNWAGQALMLFGSEEQKAKYAGEVGRGEAIFCLGYSEPNAGSGVAPDPRRRRRRQLGDQRPEDMVQLCPLRRLLLARRQDRPGRSQA